MIELVKAVPTTSKCAGGVGDTIQQEHTMELLRESAKD
jgi:hypothetical protein